MLSQNFRLFAVIFCSQGYLSQYYMGMGRLRQVPVAITCYTEYNFKETCVVSAVKKYLVLCTFFTGQICGWQYYIERVWPGTSELQSSTVVGVDGLGIHKDLDNMQFYRRLLGSGSMNRSTFHTRALDVALLH